MLSGRLSADGAGLEDSDLDVTVGQGLLDVDHLNVRAAIGASGPALCADCVWSIEQAQAAMEAFPAWRRQADVVGRIEGRFAMTLSDRRLASDISLNARLCGCGRGSSLTSPGARRPN